MLEFDTSVPIVGSDPPSDTAGFPVTENFLDTDSTNVGVPTTVKEIEAICEKCQAFGEGEGFFGTRWHKRVDELLVPSFLLYSGIGDDQALLAYVIAKSKLKITKATGSNSALVSLQITARPHDTHQRKLCSGWALILKAARAENITVENFAEWVKKRNKQGVSTSATDKRRELSGTGDTGRSKLGMETLRLLESLHPEVLEVMKTPGSKVERLQLLAQSFLMLADKLATAEEGVVSAPALADEPDASPVTAEDADD